jgi:hypothetical protein
MRAEAGAVLAADSANILATLVVFTSITAGRVHGYRDTGKTAQRVWIPVSPGQVTRPSAGRMAASPSRSGAEQRIEHGIR